MSLTSSADAARPGNGGRAQKARLFMAAALHGHPSGARLPWEPAPRNHPGPLAVCSGPTQTMKRSASALWQGDLKKGHGSLSSDSGVLKETPYSFATRFEDTPGTSPEELIAAAHAGCFSMAFSGDLGKAGFVPERISTKATVVLEMFGGNPKITEVHLEMSARVPGISSDRFNEIAANAKAGCPVSRVLRAEISLDAKLDA